MDQEKILRDLDFYEKVRQKIKKLHYKHLAIGTSLSIDLPPNLPQTTIERALQILQNLISENLPKYQEEGAPTLTFRIINPKALNFLSILEELKANMEKFEGETKIDYLRQFPEINIWINQDEIDPTTMSEAVKQNDSRCLRRQAYLDTLKLGQSIFVFDHPYRFTDLPNYIQKELAGSSNIDFS